MKYTLQNKLIFIKLKKLFKPSLLGILFSGLLFTGCSEELDLIAEDNVTDATFWQTPQDFKLAANNLYNGLDRHGFDDTESDIAFNFPNSVSNGNYQLSETNGQWNSSYTYIRDINTILEKSEDKEDAEILRYVAEARFFRAWYYWKLLRLFGGVPIITQSLGAQDPDLYTSRSSRTETVDFILQDLDDAVADLPLKSELDGSDVGRITKGTALSLSARVALFEGTWQKYRNGNANVYLDKAISSSNQVINSNQYALYTGKDEESYRYLFLQNGDDSQETILDRRYERNILGHDMPYQYDGTGYNPTRKLADLYLDENGIPIGNSQSVFQGYDTFESEFQNRDPRMTMTMIIPGQETVRVFFPNDPIANWPDFPQRNANTGYILYKYMSEDPIANNSGQMGDASLFDYDRHLIRYAEVLLIYAEATFEKNGAISDDDLDRTINLLRDRVNMPHLTNTFVGTYNLDMLEEIRRERTIELALEGFRYDDLRRWKIAETELSADIKGIKIEGTEWATREPYSLPSFQSRVDENGFLIVETSRVFDPQKHYLQPLPTREIALYNENGAELTQNPGW